MFSNAACFGLVLAYCAATGELAAAAAWASANAAAAALLVVQASCSYAGLRCYLVVVRELYHRGDAAVEDDTASFAGLAVDQGLPLLEYEGGLRAGLAIL